MTVREFPPSCPPVGLEAPASTDLDRCHANDLNREAAQGRLRGIVDRHYDFIWRAVRYLGVPDAAAEDAAQQVLCVLARRLDDIPPEAEVSFLFATARRVASEARRAARRRPQPGDRDIDTLVAPTPSPEELLDERRAQQVLRHVLDSMPVDLRAVFVLFEIEELTLREVAALLDIPIGTVGSRLRRARECFHGSVRRIQGSSGRASCGGGQ
jgi:RNA polymerase sigma-70 factor (ECF subfamily)